MMMMINHMINDDSCSLENDIKKWNYLFPYLSASRIQKKNGFKFSAIYS